MQYKRILAVGDIHGMYQKLLSLMDQVQFNPAEDLLVFHVPKVTITDGSGTIQSG